MSARLTAFVIWAAVAASAVFWLLRLAASSPSAPAHTVAVAPASLPRGDLTRVLGAPPAVQVPSTPQTVEPALASRFKLLGVAAPRTGGDRVGVALIAVDGKPARGFRVGAPIDGEMVLQSVHPRGAALGARGSPAQVTLELPPLPAAATSDRPPGAAGQPFGGVPGGSIGTLPQVPGVPLSESQEPMPIPPPGVVQPPSR
jgi:general secretion pathway protein C